MEEFEYIFEEPIEEITDIPEEHIKVYVKVNENKEIVEVGSSVFIKDFTGWLEIDSGFGDRFAHSQSQYFDKPLINEDGSYNYYYTNGVVKERL